MGRTIQIIIAALGVYSLVSWAGFQTRNPLCNEMAFWCHFQDVILWHKIDIYQP